MAEVIKRAQRDPPYYVRNILGKQINPIQARILLAVRDHRVVAVPSCHGSGKTWVGAAAVLWNTGCFPGAMSITTAPSDRQVRRGLWKEIRALHSSARIPLGGQEPNVKDWEVDADWFSLGFTAPAKDTDRFRGMHANRILIVGDEAGGISEDIYTGIKGALTGQYPRALYMGHPTEMVGEFAEVIQGRRANSVVIHISAFNTPNFVNPGVTIEDIRNGEWEAKWEGYTSPVHERELVDPMWVRERWEEWAGGTEEGEKLSWRWQALVLGQIPENVDDQLIWREWIEAAGKSVGSVDTEDLMIASIDPAGPGDNETVLGWRRGMQMLGAEGWSDKDPRGKLVDRLRFLDPDEVRIDENGVGWNLKLHLLDLGFNVAGINFGKGPSGVTRSETKKLKERFLLCRDHHFWHLRDLFRESLIGGIVDKNLAVQLSWLKYGHDSRGRVRIESKDSLRDRGLPSPDWADMLAMLYAPLPQRAARSIPTPMSTMRASPWQI